MSKHCWGAASSDSEAIDALALLQCTTSGSQPHCVVVCRHAKRSLQILPLPLPHCNICQPVCGISCNLTLLAGMPDAACNAGLSFCLNVTASKVIFRCSFRPSSIKSVNTRRHAFVFPATVSACRHAGRCLQRWPRLLPQRDSFQRHLQVLLPPNQLHLPHWPPSYTVPRQCSNLPSCGPSSANHWADSVCKWAVQ